MPRDMHLHTSYSDGQNTVGEMAAEAFRLGISEMCFTDHVWVESDWVDRYIQEVRQCAVDYEGRMLVRVGVEAKAVDMDGGIDLDSKYYGELDRVLAALHRIPRGDDVYIRASEIPGREAEALRCWLKTLNSLTKNPRVTCVCHPFSLLPKFPSKMLTEGFWQEVCGMFLDSHCEIEYSVKYDNSMAPDWLWEKLFDKIVPGSDSHSVQDLRDRAGMLEGYLRFGGE